MRAGDDGLEVLLLRRNERAGFVPGAYVFPGGRVDAADGAGLDRLDGLTPETAARRLGLPDADPPAIAYYVAALREAFEETGILVGATRAGTVPPTASEDTGVDRLRSRLLEDRIGFSEVLRGLECRIRGDTLEYIAHWITPLAAPRRFDARFFAAEVPRGTEPIVDPREMTEARWLQPASALHEHESGRLPMILPTVDTLERLSVYPGPEEALRALRDEDVRTILPTKDEAPIRMLEEHRDEG